MTFFSNLAEKIEGYTLQLTVTRNENGTLTVMIYPKVSEKEEVQSVIVPLLLTGTPLELDQDFFTRLGTPLDKTKEAANMIKLFEKAIEKAVEKAKPKDKTKTTTKAKEPGKKSEPAMDFNKDKQAKVEEPKVEGNETEEIVNEGTGEVKQIATAAAPSAVVPSAVTVAVDPEPDPQLDTETQPADEPPGNQGSMNDEEDW